MASEPTVLRRYTPPTCTLEIAAQQSPLSRWMGKLALKDLRFKLKLDDPRLADKDWVVLRGDQGQLESLVGVVGDYVQNFLSQSQDSYSGTAVAPKTFIANAAGIALEPFGLLSHQLQLGTLATADSGDSITLSSTQLADLASALDDYNAEATAIPSLARPNLKALNWGAIAAGGILTVGLSTALLQGLDPSRRNQPTQEASSGDQRVALQPSTPPSPTPSPGLTPLPLGSMSPPPPTGITITPNNSATASTTPPTSTTTTTTTTTTPSEAPPIVPVPEKADGKPVINPIPTASNKPESAGAATKQQSSDNIAKDLPKLEGANGDAITPNGSTASRNAAPIAPTAPASVPVLASNAQSQEVQSFLESKWRKPDTMIGDAEYRIQIAADGTCQAIEATNEAARLYLDRTGFPLEGEKFVSPNPDGRPSNVRVVIDKTGKIQVFLE
ncbi:MAG: DUF4335 domain-containing protein [Alkalinema sp. RU_4_3]|nr:DUF4335 domain-containing protein [Alkalinema sp. RU_4_3]